jgi:hypothetical protein
MTEQIVLTVSPFHLHSEYVLSSPQHMYTDIYSLDSIIIAIVNLQLHSASNVDYSGVDVEEKKQNMQRVLSFKMGCASIIGERQSPR